MSKEARENTIIILNILNVFLLLPVMYSIGGQLAILWFLFVLTVAGITLSIEFVILERK